MKLLDIESWRKDWHIKVDDYILSDKLIAIFHSYLEFTLQENVAKSTFNRHKSSCHALGGHIVSQIYGYELDSFDANESGEEILGRYIDSEGGPLVYADNEVWQKELDATCKKLYLYCKQLNFF